MMSKCNFQFSIRFEIGNGTRKSLSWYCLGYCLGHRAVGGYELLNCGLNSFSVSHEFNFGLSIREV